MTGELVTQVWFNGDLCDQADVRLSPFDHGLLTGDGVFETLKVTGGKVFAVRRHYERLLVSATGLGLSAGVPTEDDLRRAMAEVV
ncbi:MAG: aminotransferase class IV, partial [Actinobacteria bacterium]|nr:aminotransferase class IV [Actinomycetota bacterium]